MTLPATGRGKKYDKEIKESWDEWSLLVKEITLIKKNNLLGKNSKKLNVGFFNIYELAIPLKEHNLMNEAKTVWGIDLEDINQYRKQIRRDYYCEAGISEIVISSEGKIFPCVASIRTHLECGNIFEKSIEEIWENSDILNDFRKKNIDKYLQEPCTICEFKEFCGGGCRLSYLSSNDKLIFMDDKCPYVKE